MKQTFSPCDGCDYSHSKQNQESRMCKICEFKEFLSLDEQGKLLKLPCAVGDVVYTLNPLLSGKTIIAETIADSFFCALCTIEGRFGKTVFLTSEQAEAALKELKERK